MAPILKRRLSILGSTGSIGSSTLRLVEAHPERYDVVSLSCGNSVDILIPQILKFCPEAVSVATEAARNQLILQWPTGLARIPISVGVEGHRDSVLSTKPDVLMSAMAGTHGLLATLEAIRTSVSIVGIANKEILVMAGAFILQALKTSATKLIPVDSEHSAIFQALMGNEIKSVRQLILTGSGGPFRTRSVESFKSITKEQALKHPNWKMGAKITIDSATMMNKGLEYIEALRLFGLPSSQLSVLIHPESIVHSLVEYRDGSTMAQLGLSDMRMPISLALSYPDRLDVDLGGRLDLAALGALHFERPNLEKFPCLALAMECLSRGDSGPVVLNASNEVAVERFLKDEIRFIDIPILVESALNRFDQSQSASLSEAIFLDAQVKEWALDWGSTPMASHDKLTAWAPSLNSSQI